ncbi:unnamed protein product [Lasius platythorax]|uniref:Uncharacterized protein n=1 Tax=Lasius platythorax TaxID=488582 RepID=A0AAV2P3C7_9HYME
MEEMINNRNTQEIEENPAVENKKCLDHHEASLKNKDINAPPLHIPIFQSSPLTTTTTDSIRFAMSLNREHMDHEAALQNEDFVSPLYASVFQSSPLKTTTTDSVPLAISSNRKCMDHEAALQNEDFVSSSYAPVFQSSPLKTTTTDSVPLAISSKRKCMDHEAALQNKDFVSSSYAPVFQSEPLNDTPLELSSLNCKPPLKCKEVKEHDDRRDEFDRRKTNVHSPTFPLLTLGSVNDDSDCKRASPFEKPLELVKSTPGNPKSQNNTPLEISKNVTNLHSSKQNKDINKEGICDGDSIENQQLPQDIRRGGITSGYPGLGPAQLPHNLCPFPPSYLGINANMYPPMSSTYANSYINPNFMPPLIYAQPIPLLPPVACIDISRTNLLTWLPPIYTNMSHVNLSSLPPVTDIGISRATSSRATSSRATSSRAKSTRAKSSRVKPSRVLSPPTSIQANSSINPNFVPPLICASPIPLLPPVTRVGISHINPATCLPYINTNMSCVNPPSSMPFDCTRVSTSHINPSRFLPPPTYAGTSRINPAPPLPRITYSSTSYVNPLSSSSVRINTPPVKSPSLSSDNYVSTSHANSPSHLPPFTDVNTSRVSPAPLSPITCSSTSYVNPLSSSSVRINTPPVKSPSLSSDNYVSTSHANPPSLPPFTDVNTSRVNPSPPITCSSTSLSSDNYVSTFHANSPSHLPPFTDVNISRVSPASLSPYLFQHFTCSSTSYVNPLSSPSARINIPPVKSPSLSSDNYVSTCHANPPFLPPFTDVNTSRVNPSPPITCSSTSLSSDNYVSTSHANPPLPLSPSTDVDTSRANSSPLPPVITHVNISRAKPSPSISPPYSDFYPISPPYSDLSPISSPSSLPLVTCANTSRVNSHSSYPVIRINVSPVNPSSSLPSVT